MSWKALKLTVQGADAEAWSDALLEAGALSVEVTDAAAGTPEEAPQFGEPGELLPGVWDRNILSALFDAGSDPAGIVATIAVDNGWPAPEVSLSTIEEQDWVRLTQSQFDPIKITGRMWILPSWHIATDPGAINLVIDPGLAFGTGSHPTTRLCLQWLEAHVARGDRMLDYGCGSGILAIAAKRLGAGAVIGTDVDPQAIAAARTNAVVNRVDCAFVTPEGLSDDTFDLIAANILTNPLRILAPALAVRARGGARIVLSGILSDQAAMVIDAYAPWFNIDTWRADEGWVALSGIRRDS